MDAEGQVSPAKAADAAVPEPPRPLDPPMVPFAAGGTAAWAIAGLAMLAFQDRLAAAGHGSWIWICLAGFLWGMPGLAFMMRHDARRRRRRMAAEPPRPVSGY